MPPKSSSLRRLERYAALAVLLAAIVTLAPRSEAQTPSQASGQLTAEQRMLIDQQIAKLPLASQAIVRAEMQKQLAAKAAEAKAAPKPKPVEAAARESTPADLAYDRAQWEPVLRKGHAAQVEFDAFVDREIAARCPKIGTYARYGSGWRYELPGVGPLWERASNSADLDVQVLGPSYAPKDGRHIFDFSSMRFTFDKAKVSAAIQAACEENRTRGEAFFKGVDPLIAAKKWDEAYAFERKASAGMMAANEKLAAVMKEQSPDAALNFCNAMIFAKRI